MSFLLMLLSLSYISDRDWATWLQGIEPESLIAAMKAEGVQPQDLDERFMQALVKRPELVRVLLLAVMGQPENAAGLKHVEQLEGKEGGADLLAEPLKAEAPAESWQAVVRQVLEACERIRINESLGASPETRQRSYADRAFISQLLFSPMQRIPPAVFIGQAQVPSWLPALAERAEAAKRDGFPELRLIAGKGTDITISPAEKSLQVRMGLCQVHQPPSDGQRYDLFREWLSTTPSFPYEYERASDQFKPSLLRAQALTRFDLKKALKGQDVHKLAPGWWALRLSYSSGQGITRLDSTVYFELQPGERRDLTIQLMRDESGQLRLSLESY